MKTLGGDATRDVLLLSLTAGSADAIGYLGLGRVFTSNMTGNVVLLGIDFGQGQFGNAARIFFVLTIFIVGLCLGAWLGRNLPERQWPALAFRLIGLEKLVLLTFGIGWFLIAEHDHGPVRHGLLALLALAMGLQSAAMYRLSVPGVATTAITGTLTAFSTGFMNLLFLPKAETSQREAERHRIGFQWSVIFLYACGAALSGWLIVSMPRWAGFLPALTSAAVVFRRRN